MAKKAKVQGRKPLTRLILRPLAIGMLAICALLTALAAAAAYPAARDADALWLLCLLALAAFGAAAGGILLLLRYVSNRYLRPLSDAVDAVALAASGDLAGPVGPVPCASREVEVLLKAVGEMSEQSTACLAKMEDTLNRIASGDFTAKMDCSRTSECGGVCAALDGAVERLRGAIGNVRTALEQLSGPLDVLEQDAGAMEESAAGQRQVREGLLWSLERLDKQMCRRSDSAEGVSGAARSLCVRLEDYGRRQEELSQAVERIGECAAEAGKIVKAMESASFQCSVLARTAYIEAAGAGINGKGFAVVASELRMLAARSAQSAQDAAAFIEEMNRTAGEGASLAAASVREARGLTAAGGEVCRAAAGAVQTAGQMEDLRATIRQAASLDSMSEKDCAKAGHVAQTARLVKKRAGRLREALRAFKIN